MTHREYHGQGPGESFIVMDTDVASAILRDCLKEPLRSQLTRHSLCITFVTWGELTKWADFRKWGPSRRAALESWRREVVLLPFDEAIAAKWGELQANAQHRGRPRPVNDSWIAACCLVYGLPLATFNIKDFADYAEHDGLRLIGTETR